MKYMILLFDDGSGTSYGEMTPEDFEREMQVHYDFEAWCKENNVDIIDSWALSPRATASTVRTGGEEYDGPYMELKEQLGGIYLIDAPTPELAKEANRRCANYGANELRPLATRD